MIDILKLAKNNNPLAIKSAIKNGSDPNLTNKNGITALMIAAYNGYDDIVDYLCKKSDIDKQDSKGYTALMLAIIKNQKTSFRILIKNRANLNIKNHKAQTAYDLAVSYNNTSIIGDLEKILNLNFKDLQTELIKSVNNQNCDDTKLFIDLGANVDDPLYPLLLFAAKKNNTKMAKILINANANINYQSKNKFTALIYATLNKNIEIINLLISKKVNLNEVDKFGNTALMIAIKKGYKDIAKLLIQNGAKCDIKNHTKKTALDIAKEMRFNDIVKLISPNTYILATKITQLKDFIINTTTIPKSGDIVYTQNGIKKVLSSELGSGGEGSVYEFSPGVVAKIYKKDKITNHRIEKIKLMLSGRIAFPGICWPLEFLYNEQKEIIGYTMPSASGITFDEIFGGGKISIDKKFSKFIPNPTRLDLVYVLIKALEKINYLHQKNIILGDINLGNFLMKSKSEIFLVDTDSYQIEGFACPVGTPKFLSPKMYQKLGSDGKLHQCIRDFESENFAVSTLCFTILFPGFSPYAHKGGTNPKDNVLKSYFPYKLNGDLNDIPSIVCKNIWINFPSFLQESLFNNFDKSGQNYNNKFSCAKWLEILNQYQKWLLRAGEDSLAIFP